MTCDVFSGQWKVTNFLFFFNIFHDKISRRLVPPRHTDLVALQKRPSFCCGGKKEKLKKVDFCSTSLSAAARSRKGEEEVKARTQI